MKIKYLVDFEKCVAAFEYLYKLMMNLEQGSEHGFEITYDCNRTPILEWSGNNLSVYFDLDEEVYSIYIPKYLGKFKTIEAAMFLNNYVKSFENEKEIQLSYPDFGEDEEKQSNLNQLIDDFIKDKNFLLSKESEKKFMETF